VFVERQCCNEITFTEITQAKGWREILYGDAGSGGTHPCKVLAPFAKQMGAKWRRKHVLSELFVSEPTHCYLFHPLARRLTSVKFNTNERESVLS